MLHPGNGGVGGARSGFLSLENDVPSAADGLAKRERRAIRSHTVERIAEVLDHQRHRGITSARHSIDRDDHLPNACSAGSPNPGSRTAQSLGRVRSPALRSHIRRDEPVRGHSHLQLRMGRARQLHAGGEPGGSSIDETHTPRPGRYFTRRRHRGCRPEKLADRASTSSSLINLSTTVAPPRQAGPRHPPTDFAAPRLEATVWPPPC